MQIIDELEPVKRGGYGGAVGYLSYAGDLDTAIHIRTVVVKDGVAHVQAGGGTVADAKPEYEYEESVAKTQRRDARDRARLRAAGLAMRVLVHRQLRLVHLQPRPVPGRAGAEVHAVRNDRATVEELLAGGYERCVISPGPCTPDEAGITLEVARRMPEAGIPTLGVCLGHQALAQAFGGSVEAAPAGARQGDDDRARRAHDLRRAVVAADGRALPLARRRLRAAGLPGGVRARRRRADGRCAIASCRPRACSSTPSRCSPTRASSCSPNFLAIGLMANPILTRAIDALASRRDLSAEETAEVLAEIMHGEVSETQIAGFLIALRTKGETVEELTGLARTMRALAAHVPTEREDLLDTAGTGGGRSTFNVSTTAALIAAGAGCAVAKHGNRSATSRSGSADLLEALGARIDLDPEGVARCIEEAGFGFMFAPAHHQATRFVVPVRRELAVRTIFNLLGPLTNPAGARRQLIGVSDPRFLETIAGALARLGVDRALVVAGEDGLDEISIGAATQVVEVNGEELRRYTLDAGRRRPRARRRCAGY